MDASPQPSNELIKWLQMLTLPRWGKALLVIPLVATAACSLFLVLWGWWERELEVVSSAMAVLTISTPIILIVIGLLFNTNSTEKLSILSRQFLHKEITAALLGHASAQKSDSFAVNSSCASYISDYQVSAGEVFCKFRIELNVKKLNLVFWVDPARHSISLSAYNPMTAYLESFGGAEAEGYIFAKEPRASPFINDGHIGINLSRKLPEDFLTKPAERLYIAQDIALLIFSMLDTDRQRYANEQIG